jgi:hypothetical protein
MNPTRAFFIAEGLDILTTMVGLKLGFKELNPLSWEALVPVKAIAVCVVATALKNVPPRKIYWIIPAVAGLIVVWNVLNIVLYYI